MLLGRPMLLLLLGALPLVLAADKPFTPKPPGSFVAELSMYSSFLPESFMQTTYLSRVDETGISTRLDIAFLGAMTTSLMLNNKEYVVNSLAPQVCTQVPTFQAVPWVIMSQAFYLGRDEERQCEKFGWNANDIAVYATCFKNPQIPVYTKATLGQGQLSIAYTIEYDSFLPVVPDRSEFTIPLVCQRENPILARPVEVLPQTLLANLAAKITANVNKADDPASIIEDFMSLITLQ